MVLLINNNETVPDRNVTDDLKATVEIINKDLASAALDEERKERVVDGAEPCYKVVSIPGKGRGMIATKKLYPGDIVISETPMIVVPDKIFNNVDRMEKFLERKINNLSHADIARFLDMADCRNVGKNQFDEYQYSGKFYTNAMNYAGDAALCPDIARANHSCRPNAEFICRPDLGKMLLVVMYVVEPGQEININYMAMTEQGTDSREVRQNFLIKWYGFRCLCSACILQDDKLDEDNAIRETIKELQSVDTDSLDAGELEELISLVYKIQGKLSYILTLVEPLFKKTQEGSLRRLEYAVSGLALAINLYGSGSEEANAWKQNVDQEKSIYL